MSASEPGQNSRGREARADIGRSAPARRIVWMTAPGTCHQPDTERRTAASDDRLTREAGEQLPGIAKIARFEAILEAGVNRGKQRPCLLHFAVVA